MKKHIVGVVLAVALVCLCAAQNYKLYPTDNRWYFIKLDTRNGKMTQVQFSVEGNEYRFETILNDIPLVDKKDEREGRFELYPTENIYNFILLDTLAGSCWQVQWHTEPTNRAVVPFN